MAAKIFSATVLLLSAPGFTAAQSDTAPKYDSIQADNQASSPTDAKLVAAPALPPDEAQQFQQNIGDIHFDFDRTGLCPEDRAILASDAEWLKAHPDVLITLEGDADDAAISSTTLRYLDFALSRLETP